MLQLSRSTTDTWWGAVLDVLPSHVAVLDAEARIVGVNRSWRRFGDANDLALNDHGIGTSYLDVCDRAAEAGAARAAEMAAAIRAVLSGYWSDLAVQYDCSSDSEERHFLARVGRFEHEEQVFLVIAHEDVTVSEMSAQSLRASEARFRALTENAADLILVAAPDGAILYESPSAMALGRRSDGGRARNFFERIHPEDAAPLQAALCSPDGSAPVHLEFRHSAPDGEWRVMEGIASNLRGDPAVGGVLLNCRDVSEKRHAEAERERLSAVLDLTPDFVAVCDPQGRLSYLNDAARKSLGLSTRASVNHLHISELFSESSADVLLHEALPRALEDGVWSGEASIQSAEGKTIVVHQFVLAKKRPSGCVEYFATVAHDITKRKENELALRQRDEMLGQIAEHVSEALWIFDLDSGNPVFVSPAYERIWGRSASDVAEDPAGFLASITPAERPPLSDGGAVRDGEFEIVRPDGARRWVRGRSFAIRDQRGSVSRMVGLAEDVTERRRMECELRQAQRLEAIGHLAAGVAHEVNTPVQYVGDNIRFLRDGFQDLTAVIAAARETAHAIGRKEPLESSVRSLSVKLEEGDLDYFMEEMPRAIDQSLEGVERVAEIVRSMKEFSHPGTSERVPVDINRAIQSTLTVARNEWKYVANSELDLDPFIPPVPCFPAELNQALLNIVVNAAHAVSDVVRAHPGELGTIAIQTRRVEDDWVEIRIRDSGGGIPEAVQGRIFDPFFTTKEVGRGTGQGLTIAHAAIVDRHQGSLRFECVLGEGTTFTIRLPLEVDA